MKKMKKLAALGLAMVMAFSLMAVTAAAYGAEHEHDCAVDSEETIQPRIPAAQCPKCGTGMTSHVYQIGTEYYVEFFCPRSDCDGYLPGVRW